MNTSVGLCKNLPFDQSLGNGSFVPLPDRCSADMSVDRLRPLLGWLIAALNVWGWAPSCLLSPSLRFDRSRPTNGRQRSTNVRCSDWRAKEQPRPKAAAGNAHGSPGGEPPNLRRLGRL